MREGSGNGPGLLKRGQKWYVRLCDPRDSQKVVGKNEIVNALRTGVYCHPLNQKSRLISFFAVFARGCTMCRRPGVSPRVATSRLAADLGETAGFPGPYSYDLICVIP